MAKVIGAGGANMKSIAASATQFHTAPVRFPEFFKLTRLTRVALFQGHVLTVQCIVLVLQTFITGLQGIVLAIGIDEHVHHVFEND